MSDRTPAERLDHALDRMLAAGAPALADPALQPLLATAQRVRWAVPLVPASARFQERLATRVTRAPRSSFRERWPRPLAWLLLSGAISSALVGVGMTAYAMWRGNRRNALPRVTGR